MYATDHVLSEVGQLVPFVARDTDIQEDVLITSGHVVPDRQAYLMVRVKVASA